MSQQAANYKCPQCSGRLKETSDPQTYECQSCGRRIRESVCKRIDSFERVAESDGPLAEIARAALEGEK